jgi:hypothetical protein
VTRGAERIGLTIGAVALLLVVIGYPLVESATWQPLAAFAVPPLLAAVYSGWRVVIGLGLASTAAAVAFAWAGGIDQPALVARIVVITVVIGSATAATVGRDRRQRALERERRSTAALWAFEAGLIGTPTDVPGFHVVTRYRPAESLLRLSGDFVDTIADESGGIAFVVGDVSGHGATQAALGASLRAGWRAAAVARPGDPVAWIEAMREAFFPGEDLDHYATACTGLVRADGRASLVSAGHPWPVLLGSRPRLIEMKVGPPLGVGDAAAWEATVVRLDGPLLVYTDGLVEAADDAGQRWGEDGLLRWLRRTGRPPRDGFVDELLDAALDGRRSDDDVALLILAIDRPAPTGLGGATASGPCPP